MKKSSSSLEKIIELLNDGEYHDGTSIGNKLGITRAAVWKNIKRMESYGVSIESVKGKGYLMKEPLICLNKRKICLGLQHNKIKLEIIEKVNSTNDHIKSHATGKDKFRICIAETQTHGKGRLNRKWYSPFGKNIHISFLLPFQGDISELSGLSLVVALAVCNAIEEIYSLGNRLTIKWPNDILIDSSKIAGILIETQGESNGFCNVIIGVGINVNMTEVNKKEISQDWISLQSITGHYQDRNKICISVINSMLEYFNRFVKFGLEIFADEWNTKDYLLKKPIKIKSGGTDYSGQGSGINSFGHLTVELNNGNMKTFSSGDTTLCK